MKKYLLFALLTAIILSGQALSQDKPDKLPKLLGANNIGKEFWFTIPPVYEDESKGFPNFIKIFVTSTERTLVTVEVPGKGFIQSKNTIPNGIIEFNTTTAISQPYVKTGQQPGETEQVYTGSGVHVYADYPIVVYVVARYKYTSDGFLAIPVSSLGTEYVVAGYPEDPMYNGSYYFPGMTGIVAVYDNTTVSFTMAGNVLSSTVGGLLPGQSAQATMNEGDVWMFSSKGAGSDLSGSRVVADKPVAVVTGNHCNNIPGGNRWCDYTCEMDIPVYTWSRGYHVPRIIDRVYPSIIRIYAKVDSTTVYRDGLPVAFLNKAGGMQNKGFWEMRTGPYDPKLTPKSTTFTSDKPIGITLYNTGVEEDKNAGKEVNSDPFVMALTPYSQYQDEITFCTPGVNGNGFAENYLALIYQTNDDGSMPDDVEFARVIDSSVQWNRVNQMFPGYDEQFSYDIDGKHYALKTITLPGEGVYKIRASKKFAAYSYGYDDYDSYGYPTSAAYMDLEHNDTSKPEIKIDPIRYLVKGGDVDNGTLTGTVTDLPVDPKDRSNLSMIVLDPSSSYNYELSYDNFIAGLASTTNWTLSVLDRNQTASALVIFTDRCGNSRTARFEYDGVSSVIEQGTESNLTVGPDPASTELNIMFNNAPDQPSTIKIFNTAGSAVYTGRIGSQESRHKVDLSALPTGIYILHIHTGNDIMTRKFTVVR